MSATEPSRILIVDDEIFNCELLEMYLDIFGHASVVARSGPEALACLDSSIDLVLMDVNMPGMTGFEATAAIRANPEHAEIPIIMVTALNSQEDRLNAVRVGASDYISKPVDEVELRVRLEAQLKVKRAQDALIRHQEELERLVDERTWQLQEKNRELENKNREIQATNILLEHAVEGISQLDEAGRFVLVNAAFAQMFGYAPEQMLGLHWEQTLSPENRESYRVALQQMRVHGKTEVEAAGVRQDGSRLFMQAVLIPASKTSESGGYYGFVKDISERKSFEAKITYQAFHDALTGLANRTQFLNCLEFARIESRRAPRPLAVVFLDLDNFKVINDTLGHEGGDQLLIAVARQLKECVGSGDTIARLAGDEFTLLLEDISSLDDVVQTVERIQKRLQSPVTIQGSRVFVSASIGIAYMGQSYSAADDLLRDADLAMYHAKTQGKAGYAVFDRTLHDTLREQIEIEADLRVAVEQEQMRVYYQPLVDLETGRFIGVEALVRWEHPEKGLLQPSRFMAIAEEKGSIIPIGYWVMEEACRQAKEWESFCPENHPFTVNVNVSSKQLHQADIVERVRQILQKTGLSPSKLKLEITESVMVADMDSAIEKMHALKALGVKLALDDFGTGYSSMASLHAFPLDTVKIDRSFVHRLAEHGDAATIIGAIIAMAKSLQMDVTGEGVETASDVAELQGLGCNVGQGYLFSRPISAQMIKSMFMEPTAPLVKPDAERRKDMIEQYLWSLQCGMDERKAA